jgi:hypothetical protein
MILGPYFTPLVSSNSSYISILTAGSSLIYMTELIIHFEHNKVSIILTLELAINIIDLMCIECGDDTWSQVLHEMPEKRNSVRSMLFVFNH